MSKAPGFQLSKFSRMILLATSLLLKSHPSLTKYNREKIMSQLGKITSQLLDLRFDKVGSLSMSSEDGKYHLKECLSPGLIWHERDLLDPYL